MIVNMREAAYAKFKVHRSDVPLLVVLLQSGIRDIVTLDSDSLEDIDKQALKLGRKIVTDLGYKAL